ncbi:MULTISPECIES: hypothetical protein [unclassified Nostoc]|nr:hypothetical protein [Nostoc sp. 'Peltigera membranacea cyanobiont' 213]
MAGLTASTFSFCLREATTSIKALLSISDRKLPPTILTLLG